MIDLSELKAIVQAAERDAELKDRQLWERMEFLDELEEENPPFRRRLALALIHLGVKLDPHAAEEIGESKAA
jgi:hypothetical protein